MYAIPIGVFRISVTGEANGALGTGGPRRPQRDPETQAPVGVSGQSLQKIKINMLKVC